MAAAGQKSVGMRIDSYRKLIQYAGNLQHEQGRKVSITEALSILIDSAINSDSSHGSEGNSSGHR